MRISDWSADVCSSDLLTLVCHARKPWLGEVGARAIALEALDDTRRLHPFRHHGHVLLDDHLHLMLTPASGTDIPMLVGSFKRALRSRLPGMEDGRLWQRRYLDRKSVVAGKSV